MQRWARFSAAVLAVCVLAAGCTEAQNGSLRSGREPQAPSSDTADVLELRQRAEQGDVDAQGALGGMYFLGDGVPQNYAEAVRWYRLAADQGNAFAQFRLGGMYASGHGVPQNDVEAVRWFRLAAEQGDADAQNNLGVMYASGRGVPQNDVEAVRWFRLAEIGRAHV